MTYWLYDVGEHHRQQPEGFAIPREAERYSMEPGDIVSVGFVPENGESPEFMWMRVELARGEGRYIGILLEKPKTLPGLDANNRIEFSAENILEIYIEDGDPRWFDDTKLAMVSGYVLTAGAWPGRLMRIPPMAPEYSGWFIYTGHEPPEYIRDFDNFVSKPLAEMVQQFPNLRSVLATPIGSDWRWDAEAAEYRK
jgi:hypothetical protein